MFFASQSICDRAVSERRTLHLPAQGVGLADSEYTFVLGSVAADGQLDELVDALLDEAAASEDSSGLIAYEILRPVDPEQPVLLVSTWESEEAFESFLDSSADADTAELTTASTNTEYESVASYQGTSGDDAADGDSPERILAVDMFNATWDLLDSEDRTAEEDRTMLGSALASRLHWRHVGEPKNFSISDWQVSRVFSVLGDVDRAKEYGQSALDIAAEYGLGPFYVGYAEEALARAAALDGDGEELHHWMSRALASLDDIEDGDARELLRADLEEIKPSE